MKAVPVEPEFDVAGLMDLEGDGAEAVSSAEVADVLKGIFSDLKKEEQNKAEMRAAYRQPPRPIARPLVPDPPAPPAAPAPAGVLARLDARLKDYHAAAIHMRDKGDTSGAIEALKSGDALSKAMEQLLVDFPSPAVVEERDVPPVDVSASGGRVSPLPVPAFPMPPDAADGADEAFAHVVSLRVLEYEEKRLAKGADVALLAALDSRRVTLEALEGRRLNSGSLAVPAGTQAAHSAYLQRLDNAIEDEKARSKEAKTANRTSDALNALRRAKIMVEEKEELEGDGIANNPILTPITGGAHPVYQPRRPGQQP